MHFFISWLGSSAGPVYSVAWKLDGSELAAGTERGWIQCWDIKPSISTSGGSLLHKSRVRKVAWSPDGGYLASSSSDGSILVSEDGEI